MIDRIDVGISLTGNLSEDQQRRLLEIANKCPVHRTLVAQAQINTRLIVAGAPELETPAS
jgi:putative redox protein